MRLSLYVVQSREIYVERFLQELLLRAREKAVEGTERDRLRHKLFL